MPSPYLFSVHGFDVEFESLQVYDEGGWEFSECASAQCLYFAPWGDQKKSDNDYYENNNNNNNNNDNDNSNDNYKNRRKC